MKREFPLRAGDTAALAMLSPCIGGVVRTWTDSGARLWQLPPQSYLHGAQGTGAIARTVLDDHGLREIAWLCEQSGRLIVQSQLPVHTDDGHLRLDGDVLVLRPADEPGGTGYDEFEGLLARAVRHAVANDEMLVVELGGWDAPTEPFCQFALSGGGADRVSVIETSPLPMDSAFWLPHLPESGESAVLTAPATGNSIGVAPFVMMEAILGWGVRPWDLAFTFVRR